MKTASIVFMQGYEANEVIVNSLEDPEAIYEHLLQWDNGEYYDVTDISEYLRTTQDDIYECHGCLLCINWRLPYVELSRIIEDDNNNDWIDKLYSKAKPCAIE